MTGKLKAADAIRFSVWDAFFQLPDLTIDITNTVVLFYSKMIKIDAQCVYKGNDA